MRTRLPSFSRLRSAGRCAAPQAAEREMGLGTTPLPSYAFGIVSFQSLKSESCVRE
jgi:hypothetical protein